MYEIYFSVYFVYEGKTTQQPIILLYHERQSSPITGLDTPWVFQEAEAARFKRQSAHESGEVVSPTRRPPLPTGNIPGTHFC